MSNPTEAEPVDDERLLAHAVLAGLASAIPIPLLDDVVKDRIQRRMVAQLAAAHGVTLTDEEIARLADDESAFVHGAIKSLALWPLKKALQKTFLVLAARRVVALASECYQRGLLLDHAFAAGQGAPESAFPPAAVRAAIDEVLEEVRGGPIERALVAGLGESRTLIVEGLESLGSKVRTWRGGGADMNAEQATDAFASAGAPGVAAVVARLRRSTSQVGSEHFADLFRRLDDRLAR